MNERAMWPITGITICHISENNKKQYNTGAKVRRKEHQLKRHQLYRIHVVFKEENNYNVALCKIEILLRMQCTFSLRYLPDYQKF